MRTHNTTQFRLSGWAIVGWSTGFLLVLVLLILMLAGTGEAGTRAVIRTTAKTSLVLFIAAFSASALRQMWPVPMTRWLLTNRRYLGVSFAVSHALHLLFIVILARESAEFRSGLNAGTIIGGGGAYVFIAAMTATSFDRTAAWLGQRWWWRLHTIGVYYIWTIFFASYAPRAVIQSPWYTPFVLLLIVALGLRQLAWRQARRRPSFRPVTAAQRTR